MSASAEMSAPVPWRRSSRLVVSGSLLVGLAVLFIGYWGTSGTQHLSRQVLWVNVAASGLLMSGIGIAVFLGAGRRAVGRRRLALFGDVAPEVAAVMCSGTPVDLVAAVNMTRYHRADCPFVGGKAVASASATSHERVGRRRCGVCLGGEET